MSDTRPTILYVDDEEQNLIVFKATFRPHFNVLTATSAADGLTLLESNDVDVIVTDQRMPGRTGVEFLGDVVQRWPEPVRMVLTGYADMQAVVDAINMGRVYRYIAKPWDEADLKMTLDDAVEIVRLQRENRALVEHLARYNAELEAAVAERTRQLKDKSDELERSNASIRAQNEQITRLNKDKTEMLAVAGQTVEHPLSDIRKTANHAIDKLAKLSPDDLRAHFLTIQHAAERIHATIENLLLLNAMEQSGVKVYPTHVDPAMVAQTVVMSHQDRARAKNIDLQFERTGRVAMCYTDPNAMQQIVDHLVSNAVKFSPSGGTAHVGIESADGGVRITVSDKGPGFTQDDIAKLYTKFATLSATPTGGELTTGLGLSIVKNYVDALGGTIELQTTSGSGSTFVVTLPDMHKR
jgi:two-component system, sensor histidine kinase and response regulator